jgi:two-component system chemotaxis response regulator CheY
MKALVVDDSGVMRKILIDVLGKVGLTDVAQAADGAEAVKAATAEDFGLILMDWNMPNMLGIDALKAIRANDKTTPVIMVTTEAEKSRVLEAIKAGRTTTSSSRLTLAASWPRSKTSWRGSRPKFSPLSLR